jgi:hypothetical protein
MSCSAARSWQDIVFVYTFFPVTYHHSEIHDLKIHTNKVSTWTSRETYGRIKFILEDLVTVDARYSRSCNRETSCCVAFGGS